MSNPPPTTAAPRLLGLSPTRASAFRSCPLQFKFRYVDRLPEPPNLLLLRGTLVHLVCERLFDLPPPARTPLAASLLLDRLWEQLVDEEPALRTLFAGADEAARWLGSAERLLQVWFRLEDPATVVAAGRELALRWSLGTLGLSGIVDRLDREADGSWTITDYKTGPAPSIGYERSAFFQLRFYALLLWRSSGLLARRLRLVYLGGDAEVLELAVGERELVAMERHIGALAAAIERAWLEEDWRPRVSGACSWCAFRHRCPAFAAR